MSIRHIFITIVPIMMALTFIVIRLRAAKKPTSAKKIILPPLAMMQQDSIQKNNTSSNNYGDASRFFVLSPMNDPDAIDSQINQVKRLP